jgi:hypothetical protein
MLLGLTLGVSPARSEEIVITLWGTGMFGAPDIASGAGGSVVCKVMASALPFGEVRR